MMDAYTVLAGSYDRLTRDVDYERWADYAQRHFAKQKCPVETVLELGCGTGSLTRLLARRGYAVTALDLSPDMLAVAEQKCRGLNARFLCQDMTKFGWIGPVDAVVSGLDSVNYVTDPKKLQRAFERVHLFLMPGGLFLFDVNTPEKLEGVLAALDSGQYGAVLRAKGIVPGGEGGWLHFDYVPQEHQVRTGPADYTGRLCVIGSKLDEAGLKALFEV